MSLPNEHDDDLEPEVNEDDEIEAENYPMEEDLQNSEIAEPNPEEEPEDDEDTAPDSI